MRDFKLSPGPKPNHKKPNETLVGCINETWPSYDALVFGTSNYIYIYIALVQYKVIMRIHEKE